MTLNQIITRARTIATAHKQVRQFDHGGADNFFANKESKYPAVLLEYSAGKINLGGNQSGISFKMSFVDLVNVSEETQANELDVQSDMLSVAEDIFAQMNNQNYDDWRISADNNVSLIFFGGGDIFNGDMFAGCSVDFTITYPYRQNICAVPTKIVSYTIGGLFLRLGLYEDPNTGELSLIVKEESDSPLEIEPGFSIADYPDSIILRTATGTQALVTKFLNPLTQEIQLLIQKI